MREDRKSAGAFLGRRSVGILRTVGTSMHLKIVQPSEADDLPGSLNLPGCGESVRDSKNRMTKKESHGLGLFVRSLEGLDRQAAKEALGAFQAGKTLTSSQTEFLNLVVNHLTEFGTMDANRLYESPFTDLAPSGPEQLFSSVEVDALLAALEAVKATAA